MIACRCVCRNHKMIAWWCVSVELTEWCCHYGVCGVKERACEPFKTVRNVLFQRVLAQIDYSRPWNVPDILFGLTKSSFGANKFMLPKRRFWKAEQTFQSVFSKHFSTFRSPNPVLTPLKMLRKDTLKRLFGLPKSSFGRGKFSKHFSREWVLDLAIWATNHGKVNSKIRISSFVPPSQIFVWGSRRQLIPIFDKPAFSRISQIF